MKAKEFDIKKRDPNWRAMQDIRRSGAGGQHKDKKKAAKQGEVKHKGKMDEGIGGTIVGGVGQFFGNKIDPLAGEIMRAHGEIAGRKAEYTIRKYMHLLQKALKQQLDSGEKKEGVSESDEPDEEYLDKVISDLHKDALGFRPDQEFGQEWMSSSFEEKLKIYNNLLKSLHSDLDEDYRDKLRQMRQNTQDRLAGMRSNTQSTLGRLSGRDKPSSSATGKKTPEVGDRIEFGQFNKPDSIKKATVVKVGGGGLMLTVKTDDGDQGTINLGNKSLSYKILEDDKETISLPFGTVTRPKPTVPAPSRPVIQQQPGGEKEKENMPPKIKRLWDRIKQEPLLWAEVMNVIDEFDTLRDDEIEDEINAFLSSDTLMLRAVGIVLQYEHEKMKNESVREASDFGEPREILEDVLRTLEREVEWPLTDVMDPQEVKQLLAPIVKAVNDKMMSMEEGRRDYGYDSFGNSLRPGSDEGSTEPPNNFAIYINGKKWKVFQGKGHYADDQYEMQQFRQLQAMAARKSQETGKKWEVVRTGEPATR